MWHFNRQGSNMNRIIHLMAAAVLLITGTASAQFQGPNDETKKMPAAPPISSVFQVKATPDDTIVKMRGFIIRQVDTNEYDFTDSSDPRGTDRVNNVIKVEIADSVFQGTTVTPSTAIVVYGKRDKEPNDDEVDVYMLTRFTGNIDNGTRSGLSLTVEKGGTVSTSPSVFTCVGPNTCNANIPVGVTVTLTATPDRGWEFDDWDGCDQATEMKSGGTCTRTITTDANRIKAEFDRRN